MKELKRELLKSKEILQGLKNREEIKIKLAELPDSSISNLNSSEDETLNKIEIKSGESTNDKAFTSDCSDVSTVISESQVRRRNKKGKFVKLEGKLPEKKGSSIKKDRKDFHSKTSQKNNYSPETTHFSIITRSKMRELLYKTKLRGWSSLMV